MWILLRLFLVATSSALAIEFSDGAYKGLTVSVESTVPSDNCLSILNNLENVLSSGSSSLYVALDGRGYWKTVNVLVPPNWPDTCVPGHKTEPAQGEKPDIKVGLPHPVYRDTPYTQQSKPCGQQGDFIHLSYRVMLNDQEDIGKKLAREWAKYRYGVFDEIGYEDDPVYPTCYHSDLSEDYQVNGCSDKPIAVKGMCSRGSGPLTISEHVHPEAHSSLLFTDTHKVAKFCDSSSHDRFAPTKQNNFCDRKSVLQVINDHSDFKNNSYNIMEAINTTPLIIYKRETTTRYVLVVEDSKDMLVRDSWSYLRLAVRKWVMVQLQGQVEVGLVSANETTATLLTRLTSLYSSSARDILASIVPYTPGDSRSACLYCGVNLAYQLLQERNQISGPANSVIVLVAPGTNEHVPKLTELLPKLEKSRIKIATITYPAQVRAKSLDWLAKATNGISFTVKETNYNMATSYISTFFKLTNVLWAIQQEYYQGDLSDLPVEIHRKEIIDNGQSSVVGSFVLDDWLGDPAKFTVLVHNNENPLIRSITLVSPSHRVYSTRSDALLSLKLLTVPANINETGTWTYTIDRFPGSPQPHYVQVMATPRTVYSPVVRAKLFTSKVQDNLILYTEVKHGDYPVLGAKVEVSVTKVGINGSTHRERFELMDSGSGDPDLMKGDGIYSRYFSAHMGGSGEYTFEVTVSDNGNTAYTWQHSLQYEGPVTTDIPCCGSNMPAPSVEPLAPFQRVVAPLTIYVPRSESVVGRIGDLQVAILPSDLKARLIWTAPDMGGKPVAKYELRYSLTIGDVINNFNSGTPWAHGTPFPLAPGSETTFTLDFTRNPSLLDQTLYFAVRAYNDQSDLARPGPVSNWVRVNVPSPPPPPPVPTTTTASYPLWSEQEESVIPHLAETFEVNLELILPVVIGIVLLIIAVIVYCFFCFRKRSKKEPKANHPEKPLNVSIVPTENGNSVSASSPVSPNNYAETNTTLTQLPQYEIRVEEDTQKRYSITPYDGVMQNGTLPLNGSYGNGNLTVINEYDNHNNTLVREKTLSPYQSWTASQLLHEHERRQSPYGQVDDYSQYYPPPVPPLPNYQQDIYGPPAHLPPPNQFMNYQPNSPNLYNQSLQGSMTSVTSSERKRRNVTMV